MITYLLTEARKATVAAVSAFLAPLVAVLQAEGDLDVRTVLVAILTGLVGGLAVWAATNTPADEPGEHAADAPDEAP